MVHIKKNLKNKTKNQKKNKFLYPDPHQPPSKGWVYRGPFLPKCFLFGSELRTLLVGGSTVLLPGI